MKILHTADWHIGKQLYKRELNEEMNLYFNYLIEIIENELIDVLIVSGDIFDTSTPSNSAKKTYFNVLKRLFETKTKVIITAGNHDSILNLEAPKELLEIFDITVVGSYDNVRPIDLGKVGEMNVVLAPIPFLHDRDLRTGVEGLSEADRLEAYRNGILERFTYWSSQIDTDYPNSYKIAMGHLYIQGASISDSERDIQIGNAAGVSVTSLEGLFDYVALGHIHRPQRLSETIRYSGSPVALSFSEKNDTKKMIIVEVGEHETKIFDIPIPSYRKMVKITGTLADTITILNEFQNDSMLKAWADLDIIEATRDASKQIEMNDFVSQFSSDQIEIIKPRMSFLDAQRELSHLFDSSVMIEDLLPMEVFKKMIESHTYTPKDEKLLISAFTQLLEEVENEEL
jgi:exonuclease SbcD